MATPSSTPLGLTGDNVVDAATHGYYWRLDSSRTIRWAVAGGMDGEFWNSPASVASHINTIFENISYYTNIIFSYAGSFANSAQASPYSDITISLSASTSLFPSSSTWARAFFPDAAYDFLAGDVLLNINSQANSLPSYEPGSAGYFLFLHEIGHALGLKHPHDDGGTGHPTLASLGLSALNIDLFSVMSYEDDFNYNLRGWDPATPMLLDVLGLQYLYGKNMSTNATDTFYTLPLTNAYVTLWDAGGTDRIDVSDSSVGWTILMPAVQFSSIVTTMIGFAAPSNELGLDSPHTLYWLTGDIEDVIGSSYADTIQGTLLNNRMRGGGGNDVLDGGDGIDSAYYSGRKADFSITTVADGYSVADRTSAEGIDTVSRIERLRFSDAALALDIDGNAGKAYRIYQAAFDRAPDLPGLGYWINIMDRGHDFYVVAYTFFTSDEFRSLYGPAPSNNELITLLYQNVLHRAPDQGGFDYWMNILETNAASPVQVLVEFSESVENKAQVIGSVQNGIEYIYYA